jgi:hypothetical protein
MNFKLMLYYIRPFIKFDQDCAWRVLKVLNVTKLEENENTSTQREFLVARLNKFPEIE